VRTWHHKERVGVAGVAAAGTLPSHGLGFVASTNLVQGVHVTASVPRTVILQQDSHHPPSSSSNVNAGAYAYAYAYAWLAGIELSCLCLHNHRLACLCLLVLMLVLAYVLQGEARKVAILPARLDLSHALGERLDAIRCRVETSIRFRAAVVAESRDAAGTAADLPNLRRCRGRRASTDGDVARNDCLFILRADSHRQHVDDPVFGVDLPSCPIHAAHGRLIVRPGASNQPARLQPRTQLTVSVQSSVSAEQSRAVAFVCSTFEATRYWTCSKRSAVQCSAVQCSAVSSLVLPNVFVAEHSQ
jgi:hypothetical protein